MTILARETAIKTIHDSVAAAARSARVESVKRIARHNPYHCRYIDPARDYYNLISRIEAVDTRIARLREAGRKGHWTYNTNHMVTALGERLALRLRRMQVYADKMIETENA